MGIGLDRGFFVEVRIWNGELGIFGGFHEILVDIFDLDFVLGCRVGDCLQGPWFTGLDFLVWSGVAGTLLALLILLVLEFALGVKLFVPVPLVFIQTCYEGLDVRDLVFSAVVTPRRML